MEIIKLAAAAILVKLAAMDPVAFQDFYDRNQALANRFGVNRVPGNRQIFNIRGTQYPITDILSSINSTGRFPMPTPSQNVAAQPSTWGEASRWGVLTGR